MHALKDTASNVGQRMADLLQLWIKEGCQLS